MSADDLARRLNKPVIQRDVANVAADAVPLDECPPGLFSFEGRLGFKTEYGHKNEKTGRYHAAAYVVESGEFFWGGAQTFEERGALMVVPLDVEAMREEVWRDMQSAPKDGTRIIALYPIFNKDNDTNNPDSFIPLLIHWNKLGWDTGYWMLHAEPLAWMAVPPFDPPHSSRQQGHLTVADSLHPPPSLLSKVGSILIHLEEFEGKDGHHYDRAAVNALMSDPEVRGWLDGMHALALLPVKRSKDT